MTRQIGALALLSLLPLAACERPVSLDSRGPLDPGAGPQAIAPGPYTPGQSYFGRNDYIEYIAGNAPVIYTAPHGGSLTPSEIPDRTSSACGESVTTTTDLNTADLARRMQQAHHARFGTYPHVVINHLQRRKLDANRDLLAGACGDAEAQIAWNEWHDFIAVARAAVLDATGKGWYMDMHGHGHSIQRLELGYLTTGAQLRLSDATLDATVAYEDTSSFNTLSKDAPPSFSALLRGPTSLGSLYASNAFPSVPSAGDPAPASGDSYFTGGYNTVRHGCGIEATALGGTGGGTICGVQIEANYTGVRDTESNRQRFADVTAIVMEQYLGTHWGIQLGGSAPGIVLTTTGRKQKGVASATLSWTGAAGGSVDVFRNNALITTTANDGSHVDTVGKVSGTFTYRVCEAGTSTCSNNASVTF